MKKKYLDSPLTIICKDLIDLKLLLVVGFRRLGVDLSDIEKEIDCIRGRTESDVEQKGA